MVSIDALEAEFCPPLDPPLFRAIVSDFNVEDEASLEEARSILTTIRETAEAEAGSDFDATGTAHDQSLDEANSSSGHGASTGDTDLTLCSKGSNEEPWLRESTAGTNATDLVELDSLDMPTKTELMRGLFPELSHFTVSQTLSQAKGSWQRTLDELLNISAFSGLLDDNGATISSKSVDAFSEDQTRRRGCKKKQKNLHRDIDRRAGSFPPDRQDAWQAQDQWNKAAKDITFVATHTKLSESLVSSTYHKAGASVPKTIAALAKELMASTEHNQRHDVQSQQAAAELGADFPTIAPAYITALIQLTHPSTSSAHELAKALIAVPRPPTTTTLLLPKYAALSLSDTEPSHSTSSRPLRSTTSLPSTDHRAAHQRLSAQAASAYRHSRSNPLYAGAASYYAAEAAAAHSLATAQASAAADALVAAQSGGGPQVDLHGVSVADGVRIASREVGRWWAGLGEDRAGGRVGAARTEEGFVVVVGRGTHSEGGRGKLGPAVLKALSAEGWRVERGEGVLVVHGKVRR